MPVTRPSARTTAATSPPSGARLARGGRIAGRGAVAGRDRQGHLVHAQPGPVAGGDVVELAGQHDSGEFPSNAGDTSCRARPPTHAMARPGAGVRGDVP